MVTAVQLKLRGFSIIDDVQKQWKQMDTDKISDTAGNILTQFLSAVENFFGYLIRSFNNILPPEKRDEQIRHWLHVAAHYLIPAIVLILCIWCIFRFSSCLLTCLRFGGESTVKMMKAPGQAMVMIPRAVFEASPKVYFAGLRLASKVVVG